ncbi:2',3'-cyclic-nucleotide 3'-phosphodiesterase Ecym_5571 [Eremothecium cymbalariae DBVPG|uniref:2',3'-cyclic-nucleotide 3'-phosphodiesterase n=1 Tax=Eremothecium cymbalariae (strain CBS 270.75 / DBVPG 7215 / KCTC 17166 / NRRL Y-17582) TaxID=931890 RepID=I6NE17_ERECY|nr:hypothetical protein Ecym_5571 [Eremothecium cymbalariae DBVPG\
MGVALWYCPPSNSPCYETLDSLILSLQTLFPDSVRFEPHVTIATNLRCEKADDVSEILTAANAAMRSIRIQLEKRDKAMVMFKSVRIGKKYFEKVRLVCSEDKYLYGIAQIIRELFVMETPDQGLSRDWVLNSFEPHVSLVYSDMYHVDQALLRVVQQRIEDALGTSLIKDGQAAIDTGIRNQFVWMLEQELEGWNVPGTLKIVRCEGPLHQWEVLGSVDV